MVNWQITATTIYCDAVDDEVTLLVYTDRSVRCTGYKKYGEPSQEIVELEPMAMDCFDVAAELPFRKWTQH